MISRCLRRAEIGVARGMTAMQALARWFARSMICKECRDDFTLFEACGDRSCAWYDRHASSRAVVCKEYDLQGVSR